jgi:hypothetical protein
MKKDLCEELEKWNQHKRENYKGDSRNKQQQETYLLQMRTRISKRVGWESQRDSTKAPGSADCWIPM